MGVNGLGVGTEGVRQGEGDNWQGGWKLWLCCKINKVIFKKSELQNNRFRGWLLASSHEAETNTLLIFMKETVASSMPVFVLGTVSFGLCAFLKQSLSHGGKEVKEDS